MCKLLIVLFSMFSSSYLYSQTISEEQQQIVDNLLVEMNQSSVEVADAIISVPQDAADAGCLDGVMSIDLSVFTVDYTDIWGALYSTIKDTIVNQACSAATDYINAQATALDATLSTPLGSGSITTTQGSATTDWQSVTAGDVQMTDAEVDSTVTTGTLGVVNAPPVNSPDATTAESNQSTSSEDKETWENRLNDFLDLRTLWGE